MVLYRAGRRVKTGDLVRLKRGSPVAELLGPVAAACGRVRHTHQDDDDDGLRISVSFSEEAYTSPLPADEFEPVYDEARSSPE